MLLMGSVLGKRLFPEIFEHYCPTLFTDYNSFFRYFIVLFHLISFPFHFLCPVFCQVWLNNTSQDEDEELISSDDSGECLFLYGLPLYENEDVLYQLVNYN